MAGRSRDQLAAHEAEQLIKELGIDSLPVDPAAIDALRRLREESPAEFKRIMRAVTASPEGATERAGTGGTGR